MKRILILGPAGSGKSTLAERIGRILKIPVITLDRYFWNPNWEGTPKDEWKEKVKKLTMEEKWVMDGNYTSANLTLRVRRADSIILIDFPRRISYLRVLTRRFRYRSKTRPSVADGCPEKIDREFLGYIWWWWKTRRPQILRYLKRLDEIRDVFILRNQKQIERFIQLLAIRTSWISKKLALYSEFVMHE